MTVIRPNSISGISSITAQSSTVEFYDPTGNTITVQTNVTGNVVGNVTGNVAGNVTAPTSINVGVTTFHSTTAFVHDINSTGVVTATAFRGDASQLTGLPAGFTELDAALFN